MTTADDLAAWLDGYVRAWTTNDPDDIGRLFTEEAVYFTSPFREPDRGREEIVSKWREEPDERGAWTFRHEILAVAGDLGVVRGRTTYADPPTAFANLFLVRLDGQGRCVELTEWWMKEECAAPPPRPAEVRAPADRAPVGERPVAARRRSPSIPPPPARSAPVPRLPVPGPPGQDAVSTPITAPDQPNIMSMKR